MRWELSEIRPLQREECLNPLIGQLCRCPLPVTFHRTHNAEQGSLAAKIWGIECSLWERGAVGPSEKGARQMWSLPERRPRRRSIG